VPLWITVHGTAGFETAQQVAVFFASTASGVSAHYVIGQDGTVIQCVPEAAAAWANGGVTGTPLDTPFTGVGDGVHRNTWWSPTLNPNLVTVSIEHVKPSTDNSDELTVEQTTASFALIDSICTRWNIPRRVADASGGITGHFSMDPVNRSMCPGPYPWAQLWQYLQGGSMAPQGWHDDGTTLTAPNGHKVVQGFRQFILANSWDAANWPLEEEHGQTPLELSNPSLGGGTQQIFRWTTLEWTAQRGVFVAWSGAEILALRAALAAKKIVALPGSATIDAGDYSAPDAAVFATLTAELNA
jgi:hypothetical protein